MCSLYQLLAKEKQRSLKEESCVWCLIFNEEQKHVKKNLRDLLKTL